MMLIKAEKLEAAVDEMIECTSTATADGMRITRNTDRDTVRAALLGALTTLNQGHPVTVDDTVAL